MDIKKSLNEHLAKESESEAKKSEERQILEKKALDIFAPIFEAIGELKKELAPYNSIVIRLTKNNAHFKLGEVTTLETGWFFFTNEFAVLETNRWGEPSYETMERKHVFESSQQVIEFVVQECAKHIAKLESEKS